MRARRLRTAVKRLRIRQASLAREARLDAGELSKILNGVVVGSDEQLARLELAVKKIASEQLKRVLATLAPAAA